MINFAEQRGSPDAKGKAPTSPSCFSTNEGTTRLRNSSSFRIRVERGRVGEFGFIGFFFLFCNIERDVGGRLPG